MSDAKPCAYAIFHLNLAFSAIAKTERAKVIRACYWPILETVERDDLPLGVECSGWTLEEIARLDPAWVERFRQLLADGRCELVGSGYVQLIGPLAPFHVNLWNQKLGLDCYRQWLGARPKIALVNEMAYASGLVGVYRYAGYEGLVMERENVQLAHDRSMPDRGPWLADGLDGSALPLLWSDSLLFQKFQRWIHRDIGFGEYCDFLEKRVAARLNPLAVYCSDAEIFDYRPRRYHYEPESGAGDEWRRVAELFSWLRARLRFVSPSAALAETRKQGAPKRMRLNTASHPVPVKKQPKYNLARWAVGGRDDLRLNTLCHRLSQHLATSEERSADPERWRELCRFWSSDLRTHIEPNRFRVADRGLRAALRQYGASDALPNEPESLTPIEPERLSRLGVSLERDDANLTLRIQAERLRLTVNLRRGLTFKRLGFAAHHFQASVGTLPHGYFDDIDLGADFYSGGVIIELPGALKRIADLEPMEPELGWQDGFCLIRGRLDTELGPLVKTLRFRPAGETVWLRYDFPGWRRPLGTVRLGNITLAPEAFAGGLSLACHTGGETVERFALDRDCSHGAAVSSMISCATGLGAPTGALQIGDQARKLYLRWDPAACAAFPMLTHLKRPPSHMTRVAFSLAELDDTRRKGGTLPSFEFSVSPYLVDPAERPP